MVVLKPVDSELMPVEVDVESEATLLLVVLRPVDSEEIALVALLTWEATE